MSYISISITNELEKFVVSEASLQAHPDGIVFYLWPHDSAVWLPLEPVAQANQTITAVLGSMARGDLEPKPYPLFIRYGFGYDMMAYMPLASTSFSNDMGEQILLTNVGIPPNSHQSLEIDLVWRLNQNHAVVTFVHVLDPETGQLIGQEDSPPAQGYIPLEWWGDDRLIHEQKQIVLQRPLTEKDQILVGIYPVGQPENRFYVGSQPAQTAWQIPLSNMNTD